MTSAESGHFSILRLIGIKSIITLNFLLFISTGCSVQKFTMNKLTEALSSGDNTAITSEDDPELVKEALPFTIKMYESLISRDSTNDKLLLSTGKMLCLFSQAFILFPADTLADTLTEQKKMMSKRAKKLFLRARDYNLKALEIRHHGISNIIKQGDINAAMALTTPADTSYLYWCAAGWLGAIISDRSDLGLAFTVKKPAAMINKVLEFNDCFENGAAHESMCSFYSAIPRSLGGDEKKAVEHFSKAITCSDGHKCSPYLAMASLYNKKRDDSKYKDLLLKALEINPDSDLRFRLVNSIYRQRATYLLKRLDSFSANRSGTEDTLKNQIPKL
jgi:tetratricopeptide (TPR) repeat protein